MSDIVWKAIKLGDIFERDNSHQISGSKKILDESPTYDLSHTIMNITASKNNNGCSGYLADEGEVARLKKKGFLTIASDAAYGGICFYQDGYFVSTGHTNLLTLKNNNLKNLLDLNILGYKFIAKLITVALCNGAANRFFRSISSDFDREIILLPCLEVTKNDDYILEEDRRYYTLAVDYIEKLMNEAKELREQKTIRLYEAERAKYERERAKYEAGYKREKNILVWKGFKLGDLFDWSSRKDLSIKNYNKTNVFQEGYVEIVTGSKNDANDFVPLFELPDNYPIYHNCLCLNTNGSIGYCLYYDRDIISPTSSVHILFHKYKNLEKLMNPIINEFFAKNITRIFTNGLYNRTACLIGQDKFNREIILLPCLEVRKSNDYIWEEDGHYYTLAVDYISYMYLNGRVEYNRKLIDKYEYKY